MGVPGLRSSGQVHGDLKRGTKIVCTLKEDQSEFLEERRLKDLVPAATCEWRSGQARVVAVSQPRG